MKSQPEPVTAGHALDLDAIARELHAADAQQDGAHAARTLVREADLRVVLIAMAPGSGLDEHHVTDTSTIHVVAGRVRLALAGKDVELVAGQLLPLAGEVPHDVRATDRSTVLLTLARTSS